MTFNEWRQTRIWHDILPIDGVGTSGFMYDTEAWIELTNEAGIIWHSVALAKYANSLKTLEYDLWDNYIKHSFKTQQDECAIIWSETSYYSCTAPLTRGLDDEDAFNEMQELLTLDNDVEATKVTPKTYTIGEVTWE